MENNMEKIGQQSRKVVRITAIAAAAVISAVVSVKAMSSFNKVLGSLFPLNETYSDEALQIDVGSENTNVEFCGIKGDDYAASTALKITKTNGSSFVDSIEDAWIAPSSTDELSDYLYSTFPNTVRYTTPIRFASEYPSQIDSFGERKDVSSSIDFYFEDTRTISAYIYSSSHYASLKGETMTASAENFSVYTIDKVLYDYSQYLDKNIDENGKRANKHFRQVLSNKLETFGTGEKDGVRIMVHPETSDIVLAHEIPLDISFSISVNMNFSYTAVRYPLKRINIKNDKLDPGSQGSLLVTPFSATITIDRDKAIGNEPETLLITLADGTTVTACDQGETYFTDDNPDTYSMTYIFLTDKGDGSRKHPIEIDPCDIGTVEAY